LLNLNCRAYDRIMNSLSSSLALLGVLLLGADAARHDKRDAQWHVGQAVRTTSGTIIGHAAKGAPQVSEYLGIPFARAPVGNLRWAAPQQYRNDGGTFVAANFVSLSSFFSFITRSNRGSQRKRLGEWWRG
jgi:hypothetical protein